MQGLSMLTQEEQVKHLIPAHVLSHFQDDPSIAHGAFEVICQLGQ